MTTRRAAGTEASQATALFLGIGVGNYTHEEHFPPLPAACSEVQEVSELLSGYRYTTRIVKDPTCAEAVQTLRELGKSSMPLGSGLVVLWAGHGEPVPNGLMLIPCDMDRREVAVVTSANLVDAAARSGATQILILLDTCHSGAGAISAIELASKIRAVLPNDGSPRWIGILPSALEHERAQEGIFGSHLLKLLREGPSDPELRLRWSAHNAGVRGDDLIDVMVKEWGEEEQNLEPVTMGNAQVMFPNPRFDPEASDHVVEHLLLVARGIETGEEGDYFTGRVAPLSELVSWIERKEPGIALVTGPAGCGKSALLGRLASLSDSRQRRRILALGPLEYPDPGEGSVAAQVQARALTADGLAGRIDGQLVKAGLLTASAEAEPRNGLELQGALQRLRQRGEAPPLILIDGLEEAGAEAWAMAQQVVGPLAGLARVMVSSRPLPGRAGGVPLLESLGATAVIDLGDLEVQAQTQADVRLYVEKRLAGISAATDPSAVGSAILRLSQRQDEGAFLLARLITSELRERPVDTSLPQWQNELAGSVEEALRRDLAKLPAQQRNGETLPQAARELLAALAWAYGNGFPDDLWPLAATALSSTGTIYTRDDVFWLLSQAGRWVVEAGEEGRAVYRLAHQRLADHLRPGGWTTPWKPVEEHEAVALAESLGKQALEWLKEDRPPEEQPYIWRYFWQHAVDAGEAGIGILRELADSNAAYQADLAMALNSLGISYSELGRRSEALPATEEAVMIWRELAAGNAGFRPHLAGGLNNLGIRYSELGRRDEALPVTEEAVATYRELAASNTTFQSDLAMALNNLGVRFSQLGHLGEALPATEEAVATYRELVARDAALCPDLAGALNNLGTRYSELGRHEEALTAADEAVALHRELASSNSAFRPELAKALDNLGSRYSELGRLDEALSPAEEAVAAYRELAASNAAFQPDLARALNNLGVRYDELGRLDDALPAAEEAAAIRRVLANGNSAFLLDLAWALNNLSAHYANMGRHLEALSHAEEAETIYRELAAGNAAIRTELARALNNLGACYSNLERHQEALSPTEEAVAICRELAPDNPAFQLNLARALSNLGHRYGDLGRRAEALPPTEEEVATYRELAASNAAFRPDLAKALNNLGSRYANMGLHEDALQAAEEAVAVFRELAKGNAAARHDLAGALNNLGIHYSELGRSEEALPPTEEAVAICRELAPGNPAFQLNLARALSNLGSRYGALGLRDEALPAAEEAVATYRELAASNSTLRPDLAGALTNLGNCYGELGLRDEALAAAKEAVATYHEVSAGDTAIRADQARAFGALGQALMRMERADEAALSFARGIEVLMTILARAPEALTPLTKSLVNNYLASIESIGQDPDLNLMTPLRSYLEDRSEDDQHNKD